MVPFLARISEIYMFQRMMEGHSRTRRSTSTSVVPWPGRWRSTCSKISIGNSAKRDINTDIVFGLRPESEISAQRPWPERLGVGWVRNLWSYPTMTARGLTGHRGGAQQNIPPAI